MDELKTGEFVDGCGNTRRVTCIGAMGGDCDVIHPGDPEAMDAGKAFLALVEEAQNPWVEIRSSELDLRIRKDGSDPGYWSGAEWVGYNGTFFSDGYRACMKAYGLGGEE